MNTMIPYCSPSSGKVLALKGETLVADDGETHPVVNGIPRFVPKDNYASAFGLQWKTFAKTQLDSHNGTRISRERLERCLGFPIADLNGKTVLEVGAGAGRFTELLVEGQALVHSIDLSVAVEVNKENIGNAANYQIAQASVYEMPYPNGAFDIVLCLGVLQHTPDPEQSISCLWSKVKKGGIMVIDHYKWRPGYYSTLTPLFRAALRKMNPARSSSIVDALVSFFFPLHWAFRNQPVLNWLLHRISPLIVYSRLYPDKDREFHFEWSKLETNDQLTDYYKHLRRPKKIRNTLETIGCRNIWINIGGNGIEARGTK